MRTNFETFGVVLWLSLTSKQILKFNFVSEIIPVQSFETQSLAATLFSVLKLFPESSMGLIHPFLTTFIWNLFLRKFPRRVQGWFMTLLFDLNCRNVFKIDELNVLRNLVCLFLINLSLMWIKLHSSVQRGITRLKMRSKKMRLLNLTKIWNFWPPDSDWMK